MLDPVAVNLVVSWCTVAVVVVVAVVGVGAVGGVIGNGVVASVAAWARLVLDALLSQGVRRQNVNVCKSAVVAELNKKSGLMPSLVSPLSVSLNMVVTYFPIFARKLEPVVPQNAVNGDANSAQGVPKCGVAPIVFTL